jgi:hypothetical protein
LNKLGRADNVLIGNDPNSYLSEAKSQFVSKPISSVGKAGEIKQEGTLVLGENKNDYLTHNQVIYTDKFGSRDPNRVGRSEIDKNRVINFVTGFQGNI